MLRRIELEVLATVERGDMISELATKLDHNESYLSRAIGGLVETDDDRSPNGTSSKSWRLTTRCGYPEPERRF